MNCENLMCGITGYLGRINDSKEYLSDSIEKLKHRGPDGVGLLDLEWAGLSHCRLALIAPGPNGAQPVNTQRYVISFNGEIYNWKEMAVELRLLGVRSDLGSDSKVLVNAIDIWGVEKTLPKLRGIFAFALIDKLEKSLSLVRDSAGTKPLYYIQRGGVTYFSSEIKSLHSLGLEIDQDQLGEYLTFQNSLGSRCLFRDVFLVPAGSVLKFEHSERTPMKTIWDPGFFRSDTDISNDEALRDLERLLAQAIDRNLVADFPIGAFLSSGLDSSTISILAGHRNKNTKTYTIGFDSIGLNGNSNVFDEREIALGVASEFGLQNFSFEVSHTDMEREFDKLCWSLEEPRVGQSYPNYFASLLARRYDKSVLSGAGGDELFGGYPWRYRETLELENQGKDKQLDAYFRVWHRLGTPKDISGLLGLTEESHTRSGKEKLHKILSHNSTNEDSFRLEDLLYFEYKTFLQGLLIVDDKIAMSQGLEIRVPMLDQDLVKFAQQLPNQLRIGFFDKKRGNSESFPDNGKILLRQFAEKVENPVRNFPKKGFSGPDQYWFQGKSKSFIEERLLSRDAIVWEKIDYKVGSKLINEHMTGKSNNRLLIWSLLSLESTLRQFKI